jgi:hypothetical protein
MNILATVKFNIHLFGDKSGELFRGDFEAHKRLSHRQELLRDRLYREMLGTNPDFASPRAKDQAEMVAELKVSLVKCPVWFQECDYGLDLIDDSVLRKVWEEVMKIRLDAFNELKEKAQKAEEALKKEVESKDVK